MPQFKVLRAVNDAEWPSWVEAEGETIMASSAREATQKVADKDAVNREIGFAGKYVAIQIASWQEYTFRFIMTAKEVEIINTILPPIAVLTNEKDRVE